MPRFVVELLASIGLSALCLGIGSGAIGAAPMQLLFGLSALVMLAVPFIGPSAIVVYGLIKQRFGVALGPVLLFAAIPIVSELFEAVDAAKANSAIVEFSRPVDPKRGVAALDRSDKTCDSICLQILARSEYDVMIDATKYERALPSDCLKSPFVNNTLDFIAHGYADVCASIETSKAADAALVIREISVSKRQPYSELPSTFGGRVYELYSRAAGSEQLLGRWVTGGVGSRLPEFLLLPAKILGFRPGTSVGTKFPPSDFYGAALGMTLSSAAVPGTSDPRVLLNQLQSLPEPIADEDRAAKLLEIVRKKAFILDALEAATIAGGTLKYNEVAAAFSALKDLPQAETGFVTAVMQDLAERDDPHLLSAVLSSLMPLQDTSFANDIVIKLATQPMSQDEEAVLTKSIMRAVVFVWKTSEERLEAIKQTYSHDFALRPIQRWAILKMIADNQGRVRAVETVLNLQSPLFEQSVQAAKLHGQFAIPLGISDGWTFPECDVLVERSATLPTDALMAYLESVLDQCSKPWSKRNVFEGLYEKLHPRIVQLENSGARNSKDIQNIRAVLERFATNTSRD